MNSAYTVLLWMLVATGGIFIFSWISFSRIQKKRHYKCPHCGYRFKPGGTVAFFSRKQNVTDRLLYCPHCGTHDFMENIDDDATKSEPPKNDRDDPDQTL